MKLTAKTIEHIKKHQSYPATKADLIAACNNLTEFSDEEKKSFAATIPNKTFRNADEVIKALV